MPELYDFSFLVVARLHLRPADGFELLSISTIIDPIPESDCFSNFRLHLAASARRFYDFVARLYIATLELILRFPNSLPNHSFFREYFSHLKKPGRPSRTFPILVLRKTQVRASLHDELTVTVASHSPQYFLGFLVSCYLFLTSRPLLILLRRSI